jgi:hypothetical protein
VPHPLTVSATSSPSLSSPLAGTSLLTILSEAAANATQLANTTEISEIDNAIQKQLNDKIAVLQAPPDAALTTALQNQISSLQTQQSSIADLSPKYGANADTLANLQTQLATLQTAAANGDSATFDATLSAANLDVQDLNEIIAPAPLQPDGISGLIGNGLGIGDSASYDLSIPAGQTAAEAAVTAAQNVVQQVFQVTSSNQLVANDLANSLSTQIGNLQSQLDQLDGSNQTQVQNQIASLTQQAQDQEHLIELSLGNTQTIATALYNEENPPQPITSVFGALEQAVAATPSTYSSTNSTPAVLSLLS